MAAIDNTEFRAVESFRAAITQSQVRMLEEAAASNETGRKRRAVLVVMASDSKTLTRMKQDDPQLFAAMVSAAHDYEKHAAAAHELAESAIARLAMIGLAD